MKRNTRFFPLAACTILASMVLTSCGLPGALGRSYRRIADFGTQADDAGKAREIMVENLRQVQREVEAGQAARGVTAGEAGSKR